MTAPIPTIKPAFLWEDPLLLEDELTEDGPQPREHLLLLAREHDGVLLDEAAERQPIA